MKINFIFFLLYVLTFNFIHDTLAMKLNLV